jgi:hypothetical protein
MSGLLLEVTDQGVMGGSNERHLDEERSNQLKLLGNVFLIGLLVILVMVSGCAHQPLGYAPNPRGFWVGIWHGLTIGFSMIGHLFDQGIRIYAFPNSGGWYDSAMS